MGRTQFAPLKAAEPAVGAWGCEDLVTPGKNERKAEAQAVFRTACARELEL